MSDTVEIPAAASLGNPGDACRSCGAELATDQRYCVNCGARRADPRVDYQQHLGAGQNGNGAAPAPGVVVPATAPVGDDPGATRAISPLGAAVAVGLLLIAVLLGAVIGKGNGSSDKAPVLVGSAQSGSSTNVSAQLTDEWGGSSGWTIQVTAVSKDGADVAQVNQTKSDVQAKGASDVGVLDSDLYPSLEPAQWVVFAGRYDSKAQASKALGQIQGDFPDAKVVEVSTDAAGASGKDSGAGSSDSKATNPALSDLQSSSPEDYSKKSKKLPDTVGTGGAPPPTDKKAPGGGSGGTTIK